MGLALSQDASRPNAQTCIASTCVHPLFLRLEYPLFYPQALPPKKKSTGRFRGIRVGLYIALLYRGLKEQADREIQSYIGNYVRHLRPEYQNMVNKG